MKTTAIILNWNTTDIVLNSVERLLPETGHVVVVDNGSDDASYLAGELCRLGTEYGSDPILVQLPRNMGISFARNCGIRLVPEGFIFLLDGDIMYVPGTITEYSKVLERLPHVECVGQHDSQAVATNGYNGTKNIHDACAVCPTVERVHSGFPMVWTQYGLFRGDLLRKLMFPMYGSFAEPGHGWEDDYLYWRLYDARPSSKPNVVYTEHPLYFHDAHSSLNQLPESNSDARAADFALLMGSRAHWSDKASWAASQATWLI